LPFVSRRARLKLSSSEVGMVTALATELAAGERLRTIPEENVARAKLDLRRRAQRCGYSRARPGAPRRADEIEALAVTARALPHRGTTAEAWESVQRGHAIRAGN